MIAREKSTLLKWTHVAVFNVLLSTREPSNGTHMNVMPKLLCAFFFFFFEFGVYRRQRQRIGKMVKRSKCKVSKSVGKKCKRYDNSKMCFFSLVHIYILYHFKSTEDKRKQHKRLTTTI